VTLTEIQQEAASLGAGERQRLVAFLVAMNLRADPTYRREIEERMADTRPESWIPLAEARRRLRE